MKKMMLTTRTFLSGMYIEIEFHVLGEYAPATLNHPEDLPTLEILKITDLDRNREVEWGSTDFVFKKYVEDMAWMEYDMYCAEKRMTDIDTPLESHEWEGQYGW